MSVIDGFDLYDKLYEISKKVQQDISPSNDFMVCFITASRINYTVLAEIHPEFEECHVCEVQFVICDQYIYSRRFKTIMTF
jgi:hypothetical protein